MTATLNLQTQQLSNPASKQPVTLPPGHINTFYRHDKGNEPLPLAAQPEGEGVGVGGPNTQPQPTPPPGHINTFYRTYKGRRLGPYYVRRWKVGAKLHKQYIKPADLERAKAECQAYKEFKKKCRQTTQDLNNMLGNLDYMLRMCKWEDEGRLRPVDYAFMRRLKQEGFKIPGRPPTRRRVTRHIAQVGDKTYIVKTVFELDGTTKTFMVPFSVNRITMPIDEAIESLRAFALEAWVAFHGPSAEQHTTNDQR